MPTPSIPLPERVRPRTLQEVRGQDHLLGSLGVLSKLVEKAHLPSMVLWGPPGCGKTTIARLLADACGMFFTPFSAVLGGVPELRKLLAAAAEADGQTLLFVDEIHRFNKAQQDALLPHVEKGTVVLVGATTENPSFSCNRALMSRCRVCQLRGLDEQALADLIDEVAEHPEGLPGVQIEADARESLVRMCGGDARRLLLMVDECWAVAAPDVITNEHVAAVVSDSTPGHDRAGESHYDVASAFIKSMRASDVQASLYYLARQLESGEDPRFVARRLVIFACEDVGLADPQALLTAQSAQAAIERIGMPEAIYPLTQATIYNATAPKSNSTKAYFAAAEAVRQNPGAEVPMFLRNAPTTLMKELGYKKGYQYDHDTPDHYAGQQCLPEELLGREFYTPGHFGFEKDIAKRLDWWKSKRG